VSDVEAAEKVEEVEVVVLHDFDGYFEHLTRRILARADALGHALRYKVVQVDAAPYRGDGLRVVEVDPDTVRLDFYSALRKGFGSLSAQDLDDAARLL
jgi:hypothetical protein